MAIENISENGPSQESNGPPAENNLSQHVQRLNCRVAALEKDLAESRIKCDQYGKFVALWALTRHSQEELEQWAMDDDLTTCLPLDQFIGELEAIVHQRT